VFNLYISLLRDPFWNLSALEAVLAWLQDETSRIEDALLEETSLQALLRAFSEAKAATFENILEPLLKVRVAYRGRERHGYYSLLPDCADLTSIWQSL
jgi:hypothetical protein